MFFVFGAPRSGTTLLAQCLSAHSKIIIPYETDFIIPMAFIFDRGIPEDTGRTLIYKLIIGTKGYKSLAEYLKPEVIYDVIYSCEYHPASILKNLYAKIAEVAGAELAGDKSPNDLGFFDILLKTETISSDIKVIHMVRDIRDVMVSLERTGWLSPEQFKAFPGKWNYSNIKINTLFKDNQNYKLIRYEDLVANPRAELETLTLFLGYQFEEGMLDPEKRHPRYKKLKAHSNLYDPISSLSVNNYCNHLKKAILKNIELHADTGLLTFGYRKDHYFLSVIKKLFDK